jgi:hypothetical protein
MPLLHNSLLYNSVLSHLDLLHTHKMADLKDECVCISKPGKNVRNPFKC